MTNKEFAQAGYKDKGKINTEPNRPMFGNASASDTPK